MDTAINNPLYGIQTGSIAFAETGGFGAPVINDRLTRFINQSSGAMSMTGNSDYLYTDHMNQGSLGIAGSYGVSGVAKFSAAVSAYLGNSVAEGQNTLSITLNYVKWGGVEFIDFDSLDIYALLSGLKDNVSKDAENVLEKYVAMQQAFQHKTPDQVLAVLNAKAGDGDKDAASARAAFELWNAAVADFLATHGTGIVVGVLWGGWGAIKLDVATTETETRWKAGGSGDFTYAGPQASVDFAASYGHSESSIGAGAKVSVSAFFNGACIEKLVNAWFDDLKAKAATKLEKIGGEKVTLNAALSEPLKPPAPPDFVKPPPGKPSVTALMGKISDLDGLKAYAKASAWEKYKQEGGDMGLDAFLAYAGEKNDVSAIPTGTEAPLSFVDKVIIEDDEAPREGIEDDEAPREGARPVMRLALDGDEPKAEPPKAAPAGPPFRDFEPLGLWIAGWNQLFPWLVSAYSNEIPKDGGAASLVRLKTLQQDFITLEKLYSRFAQSGLVVFGHESKFADIANSFGHGSASVAVFLRQAVGLKAGGKSTDAFITQAYAGLSPDAQEIYKTWCKYGLLRGAELGLGICLQYSDDPKAPPLSITGWSTEDVGGLGKMIIYPATLEPCAFRLANRNFSEFYKFLKGAPLILPDKQFLVYVNHTDITKSGILCGDSLHGASIVRHVDRAELKREEALVIDFAPQTEGKDTAGGREPLQFFKAVTGHLGKSPQPLHQGTHDVQAFLYPIPFEAANGAGKWQGCALATGLGTLDGQLAALRGDLANKPRWSFDSDFWDKHGLNEWTYALQRLSLSYIGVTADPGNVMPKHA